VTTKKGDQYEPKIETGLPPAHYETAYDTKMFEDSLRLLAERIERGQYVKIPAGSKGKFKKIVESRGLKTIHRLRLGDPLATVYVVTPEWLAGHPDVLKIAEAFHRYRLQR
jgi:hypothetical protein